MQIVRLARLSLLTLVLLVTLILASSAFAAAPVKTQTASAHHGFSYMGMGGGGCPFSGEYASSVADD